MGEGETVPRGEERRYARREVFSYRLSVLSEEGDKESQASQGLRENFVVRRAGLKPGLYTIGGSVGSESVDHFL
jgi:hypothetical protein